MKYKITMLFAFIVSASTYAQSYQIMADCDTAENMFITPPCKVPHFKNGKIAYYTVKEFHLFPLATTTALVSKDFGVNSLRVYKWLLFNTPPSWSVDDPQKNGGKYIIHIQKKYFKWINDSTAVYQQR